MRKTIFECLLLIELTVNQRTAVTLSDSNPQEYTINIQLPAEWGVNEIIKHEIKTSSFQGQSGSLFVWPTKFVSKQEARKAALCRV